MQSFAGLAGLLKIEKGEARKVTLSALYFLMLLASYYLLRPLRDEMGIRAGVDQLQWLFSATFAVMLLAVPLFGWASSRWARHRLIPTVYLFFTASLFLFYLLLQSESLAAARAFYVWVSVYNLFVISVFWSLMADIFSQTQGKRLFGLIAAGGSTGAVLGPALAASLSQVIGPTELLLAAALLLFGALVCARLLTIRHTESEPPALGGSIWEGVQLLISQRQLQGIALFIWLYTTLATILYFQQAHIIASAFNDPADRTSVFAMLDFAVNLLTIVLQLFITGRLMQTIGLGKTLALVPAILAIGFAILAVAPVLSVLAAIQVVRRAGNYGLTRPAREVLYTQVAPSARYKSKNFIDTVVYRGGDALAGWFYTGLKTLGLGIGGIALLAVPLALAWAFLGLWLGRKTQESFDETHKTRSA